MRRMIAGALSALVAACASAPPPGPYLMPLGEARVEQLLGRTQHEVRVALGASNGESLLIFDTASLDNGLRVVSVAPQRMFAASNPCAEGYHLEGVSARVGELAYGVETLVFRDRFLAEVVGGRFDVPAGALSADAVVRGQCRRLSYSTTGSDAGDAIIGISAIVWFAPLIGVALAGAAVGSTMDESDQRVHALAVIRLGAPLPDGVDAYIAAHPQAVRVMQRNGDDVNLGIQLSGGDREANEWFGFSVRDGIVQSVNAPTNRVCRLEDDGSVRCQR